MRYNRKYEGSHIRYKIANECLDVWEGVDMVRKKKDGPLPCTHMTSHVNWVDEIEDVMISIKMINKILFNFFIIFCFLPLCVKYINTRYISIQNIGRSIPLKTTNWIGVNSLITVYVFTT